MHHKSHSVRSKTQAVANQDTTKGILLKVKATDFLSDMEQEEEFENVEYLLFSNHKEFEFATA